MKNYRTFYRGYVIEKNEYPHPKYKLMFNLIDYDGEPVGLGTSLEDCKTQIDEQHEN